MVTKEIEEKGETQLDRRATTQFDYIAEGASSASTPTAIPTTIYEREGEKSTFERAFFTHIDYYDEAGSLLIAFNSRPERILKSDALVLLGLSHEGIASIEILLDDKEVAENLSKALKPYRYR